MARAWGLKVYDGVWRRSGGALIGGLVRLAQARPFPGQQFVQTGGGKIGDTGDDVGEPGLGIDVVEATCRDHRQHDGGTIGATR